MILQRLNINFALVCMVKSPNHLVLSDNLTVLESLDYYDDSNTTSRTLESNFTSMLDLDLTLDIDIDNKYEYETCQPSLTSGHNQTTNSSFTEVRQLCSSLLILGLRH